MSAAGAVGRNVSPLVAVPEILSVTFRQLLGRRRTILLVLLSAVPVLLAIVFRAAGETGARDFAGAVYDGLCVSTLLPIVAVLFGTATFGAEIEDGTIVYLLAKPVARWQIILAKILGATAFTALLTALSVILSGIIALAGTTGPEGQAAIVAFTLAMIVGSACYCVVFAAISLFTRRALVVGVAYMLIWEGGFASLLPGIANFSIRQYALGVAKWAYDPTTATLDPERAIVMAAIVVVAGLAIATWRLTRFELPSSSD